MTGAGAWRTSWRSAALRPPRAGIPAWLRRLSMASGVMGWPPRRPGNSQRASALVAVVRLSRWPAWRSSRLAKGSGTGAGGSPSRIATSPSSWMDVVEGQAQDAGQRLGVEQHQDGGDAGEQLGLLVGEQPLEQVQALPLADRGRVGGVLVGDGQPGAGACCSSPSAGRRGSAGGRRSRRRTRHRRRPAGSPRASRPRPCSQARNAIAWLTSPRACWVCLPVTGPRSAKPRSRRRTCQEANRSTSWRCSGQADPGQGLVQPALEQRQVAVGGRQDAVQHQQVAQVGHRPPRRHAVERLVRDRRARVGQRAQHLLDVRAADPGDPAPGPPHLAERRGERRQLRPDAAGPVVEQDGQPSRPGRSCRRRPGGSGSLPGRRSGR